MGKRTHADADALESHLNFADAAAFFFFELYTRALARSFQNHIKITKAYFRILRRQKENFNLLKIIRGIDTLPFQ